MKFCTGQRGSRGQFSSRVEGKNHLGAREHNRPDQEKSEKEQVRKNLAGPGRIPGRETLATGVRRLQWQPLLD